MACLWIVFPPLPIVFPPLPIVFPPLLIVFPLLLDAPAAPVPNSPDLPAAARVAADKVQKGFKRFFLAFVLCCKIHGCLKEEEDELSKLLAQEVDAKPEKVLDAHIHMYLILDLE